MLAFYLTILDTQEEKTKFEQLYFKYRQDMYKVAYRILRNSHDAEDAVHEALMILTKNIHKISSVTCPQTKSYLIIIVKNVAINLYNFRKKVIPTDFEEWECEDDVDMEDSVIEAVESEALVNYLMQLSENDYNVLYLKYYMDMSIEETATSFGISYEAAKKRILRAKERLFKLIRGYDHE